MPAGGTYYFQYKNRRMLLPQIQITQESCDEITIKDITPAYSPSSPGGYGALNVDADEIILTKVIFDFGKSRVFSYETPYNQTKEDIIVDVTNFRLEPAVPSTCYSCGPVDYIPEDEHGYLTAFPDGCINITYKVFSGVFADPTTHKLEGVKVLRYISTCKQDKMLLDLADKISTPNPRGYYDRNPEERKEVMANFILVWQKLQLLEEEDGCDCECVAAMLKQIDLYLKSIRP